MERPEPSEVSANQTLSCLDRKWSQQNLGPLFPGPQV